VLTRILTILKELTIYSNRSQN